MSFFQNYRSIERLNQFPQEERFQIWLAAHERLKNKDAIYRAACNKFKMKCLVASLVFVAIVLASEFLQGFDIIEPDCFMFPWIVALIATAVYLPYILTLSFREQTRRNVKVAEEIGRQPIVA